MNEQPNGTDGGLSRRTFLTASGALAGAGLVGAGAAGAATDDALDSIFYNVRVREARKAWERGYRGRADRALALTDSGADGRHPDLGPWNDVTATTTTDGALELYDTDVETREVEIYATEKRQSFAYTGAAAGAEVVGLRPLTHGPFSVDPEGFVSTADEDARIRTVITWEPSNPEGVEPAEFELRLMKNGEQLATTGFESAQDEQPQENRKELVVEEGVELDPEDEYEVWVYGYRAPAAYDVVADVEELDREEVVGTEERVVADRDPLSDEDLAARLPAAGEHPELLAWHNGDASYGEFHAPRDDNGHGTHVSGIMTGTGQASTVDEATTDAPNAVLLAGDTLTYEVAAAAGTGVFAAATGDGIELVVEGPDGRQLARSVGASGTSEVSLEANITQTPTVHDDGTETYRVHVRTTEGEAFTVGRVREVAVGSFAAHDATCGEALADDDTALHAGVAPGNSLVAVTGLGTGTNNLARAADDFAAKLNVRAVNMSWGAVGGVPFGALGGVVDTTPGDVEAITDAGILTVAAAGNAATPANGNSSPAVVEEAVSVVATGPRDGIASYSSGGVGGVNEDGEPHGKPDVTAPGGVLTQLDWAAEAGDPDSDGEYGDVRGYTGKGGTSMASPSVCGIAGLVAEAMEFGYGTDGRADALTLPEPADTTREDVMRLKQVLLATASETAFTAAPYHRGKAPTYTHGERDPYEGYGRANVDAAVDAVTRDLLPGAADLADDASTGASHAETVGLDVPEDSRAVAGYVTARGGTLEIDLAFSRYAGGNEGMTKGDPHLDLFVYDAESPAANGEPNVVASDRGVDGTASVSVDVPTGTDAPAERTFLVVAKLVNVPGVVNGYDVRAHFDLDCSFEAGKIPLPAFTAAGGRATDSAVELGGNVHRVVLTVTDLEDDAVVADRIPDGWEYLEEFSEGAATDEGVEFREVAAGEVAGDDSVSFTYFVESPGEVGDTGAYTFGPAVATVADADAYENDTAEFAGETDVVAVAVDV